MCCGRSHTICASASGRVFCWGDNTHSQCGVVGLQVVARPHYIPVVTHSDGNLKRFMSESTDSTEQFPEDGDSAFRDSTESGDVDGMCSRPQCCHSRTCHASQTGCSGVLVNAKVVRVSCGWTHTAALSNCGKLWSWGTGIQVGVEECVSAPVPYPVEFPADRRVISVSCGGQHTVALTVRHEVVKSDIAAVNEAVKSGMSRTLSYGPDVGPNTSELIKLTNVPPEAKKGIAKRSALDQQKTDSDIGSEKDHSVDEAVDKAAGLNIPMQSLSLSGESGKDNMGTDSDVGWQLASTCIDDVEVTENCDFPANINSENSEAVVQLRSDSNTKSIPIVRTSDSSSAGCGSVPKSRSSFLDETEAIMFLEKQLSDSNTSVTTVESRSSKERNLTKVERKDVQEVGATMSPFAKTVESLLQHVPSSPVVQEYVSNLTRSVVSNLRTSVDRRLNYVTSQVELSMRSIAPLNKVAESGDAEVSTALDDTALLDRLALSNIVSDNYCYRSISSLPISVAYQTAKLMYRSGRN